MVYQSKILNCINKIIDVQGFCTLNDISDGLGVNKLKLCDELIENRSLLEVDSHGRIVQQSATEEMKLRLLENGMYYRSLDSKGLTVSDQVFILNKDFFDAKYIRGNLRQFNYKSRYEAYAFDWFMNIDNFNHDSGFRDIDKVTLDHSKLWKGEVSDPDLWEEIDAIN